MKETPMVDRILDAPDTARISNLPRMDWLGLACEGPSIERIGTELGIRRVLESLPARERQVLELYYFEDMTNAEIATIFRVTTPRIQQIHSKALRKLWAYHRMKYIMPGDEWVRMASIDKARASRLMDARREYGI